MQTVGLLQDFSLEPEFGGVVGHWTRIGRAKGRKSRSGHPLQPQLGCEPRRLEIRSKVHPGVPTRVVKKRMDFLTIRQSLTWRVWQSAGIL